jgi:hypothetical protein
MSLVQRRSDAIKYDLTRIGDEFGWLEVQRGLDLSLLDDEERIDEEQAYLECGEHEDKISSLEYKLEKAREKYPQWLKWLRSGRATQEDKSHFDSWVANQIDLKKQLNYEKKRPAELQALISTIDSKYEYKEEEAADMYTFFEMYIDKFTLGEMAALFDIIEGMKHNKEISWNVYLDCGIALSYRLAQNTKMDAGWWAECDRLRKHKEINHNNRICASYEDRFYGEMAFDMEGAVDLMAEARELAQANDVELQHMFYQMMEYREAGSFSEEYHSELY